MFDIVDRFEKEFNKKNPEVMNAILFKLLNLSSEIVAITTFSEGRLVYCNDAIPKLLDCKREEVIGRTVDQLNIYENPTNRVQLMKKVGAGSANVEMNFKTRSGNIVTYLLSAATINLLGVHCIITVGWDITKRRKLEEELHAALKNDLYQTVRALDNLVFRLAVGADGRLTYVMSEGKIARDMGLTTEVVSGKTIAELFPPPLVEIVQPHLHKALSGEATSFEIEVAERVMIKTLSPYFEHGNITGVVGSAIDITERKKLEKLLQVSELNSALGQLAAGAAHEIRNPLTAIKGFIQLIGEILEKNSIVKGSQYVELILSELSRINHLVGEMLWLRKPKESTYEDLNVSKLLQEVLPLVYVEANLKSIQVLLQLNSNSPNIRGNRDLLKQVILNICKNGIQAMDDGGTLYISETYNQEKMTILVKDSGSGIPLEIQDKIFTPFFTTKKNGTGLGLFICKQIINDMDGEIKISSDSSGTSVTINFALIT